MSFILLGILNSQVSAVGGGSYELIESTILSTTTASVTFSNLDTYASTYKHLQVRLVARSNQGSNLTSIALRMNGITTSSYNSHFMWGNGTSVQSSANGTDTFMYFSDVAGGNATANSFGAMIIDVLDFSSSSKNTTLRGLGGAATSSNIIALNSGLFNNTAAATSLLLQPLSGSWVSGSRFSLYGIKG